ncbi:MAG: M48 family metalloprotease [Deltaproteobacteria bacterium]|nr:M48 family metalloprotease [Deltaproteobacteria bacterium]
MKLFLKSAAKRKWSAAVAMAFLVACMDGANPPEGLCLSLSEEKDLGKKMLEMVKERMSLVEDVEILTYVQSIGKRVAQNVGTTPYHYQFFIINEPVPNAFAIPGGYIFIYRGLMELMGSEGELAGILCHELAHIQARHIHRRMEEGRLLNIASIAGALAGILIGMNAKSADMSNALSIGSMAGAAAMQLKYSRENEEEADQLGFRYLLSAGYPSGDMLRGMERLNQGRFVSNSRLPSYLSTHPALSERISYLAAMVDKEAKNTQRPPRKASVGDFSMMKAALVADYTEPQIASERLQASADAGETSGIYGLGRLYLRRGNLEEAVRLLQRAARMEPTSSLALSTLGAAYHKQGKYREARSALESALALNPSSAGVHLRLAAIFQEQGQNEAALEHLKEIEELGPTFPEIDYQLGLVLGRMNSLGPAHFHLGRFYESRSDWKNALFHYSKAKPLLMESMEKQHELERLIKDMEKKRNEAQWKQMRK